MEKVLYEAPQKVRMIAYTTLCQPLIEYAAKVWDPHLAKHANELETVRFIARLRGNDSNTDATINLELKLSQDRRREAWAKSSVI